MNSWLERAVPVFPSPTSYSYSYPIPLLSSPLYIRFLLSFSLFPCLMFPYTSERRMTSNLSEYGLPAIPLTFDVFDMMFEVHLSTLFILRSLS
jgi:hypothetical protein